MLGRANSTFKLRDAFTLPFQVSLCCKCSQASWTWLDCSSRYECHTWTSTSLRAIHLVSHAIFGPAKSCEIYCSRAWIADSRLPRIIELYTVAFLFSTLATHNAHSEKKTIKQTALRCGGATWAESRRLVRCLFWRESHALNSLCSSNKWQSSFRKARTIALEMSLLRQKKNEATIERHRVAARRMWRDSWTFFIRALSELRARNSVFHVTASLTTLIELSSKWSSIRRRSVWNDDAEMRSNNNRKTPRSENATYRNS